MLTSTFERLNHLIVSVEGQAPPEHLAKLRIPPAWEGVQVDPDPQAKVIATGLDAAGRRQAIYSPAWVAAAKSGKFERVRCLLSEWEDIRTQIEADLNRGVAAMDSNTREAALVALLIYETGMRPGSAGSARGDASQKGTATFGATTLQMRHIKPAAKGVRLQFVGKKGVHQNVLVTNPYLVRVMLSRKRDVLAMPRKQLFNCSDGLLRQYFATLGSGDYTPKDFRTARGTSLALELLGGRKRLPKSMSGRKRVVNAALDRVAAKLGNTRAISRSAYVDPGILERFLT